MKYYKEKIQSGVIESAFWELRCNMVKASADAGPYGDAAEGPDPKGRVTIPLSGQLDDRRNVKKNPKTLDELPEDIRALLQNRSDTGKRDDTILDILGSKHMLTTLLYVNRMSPVLKSDIYNNVSKCSNMSEKVHTLHSLGLVDIYRPIRTRTNVVVITEKGR